MRRSKILGEVKKISPKRFLNEKVSFSYKGYMEMLRLTYLSAQEDYINNIRYVEKLENGNFIYHLDYMKDIKEGVHYD